ncbi:hypothetical protein MBLNU13_g04096t3 [Cladosporium sp. NU13]
MDAKTYDRVVQRAAVLASRLLESPQALHYFHAIYFGENIEIPGARFERYGSDKKINTLTSFDIESTREELILLADKVGFEFFDTGDAHGQCYCFTPVHGVIGCKSVILLRADLYSAAQEKACDDAYNAMIDFRVATTMLHESVHAAFNDVEGHDLEDCFEESFVVEAVFELESRTFGLCWVSDKVLACYDWQTSWLREAGYNLFWDGEYARRGGVARLPPPVIDICQQRFSGKTQAYVSPFP